MLRMYKYIIYCSISAAIILISKYVYQNWIKQAHRISELQNNINLLQNKVKQLEGELEKFTVSGGVKIPIVFKNIEKKPNNNKINFSNNESTTIVLNENLDDISENQVQEQEQQQEASLDSRTSSTSSVKSSASISLNKQPSPKTESKKKYFRFYR